jgi:hypothetical protein
LKRRRDNLTPFCPLQGESFRMNPSPYLWRGGIRGRGEGESPSEKNNFHYLIGLDYLFRKLLSIGVSTRNAFRE